MEMTQVAHPAPAALVASITPGQEEDLATVEGSALPLPLVLRLPTTFSMDDEQFLAFCSENGDLRIERTAEANLVIMPPAGEDTPIKCSELNRQLANWAKEDGTGRAFGSSAGFTLPNKAIRGPDAAWVLRERLAALTLEKKKPFVQLCPDFVVELRSPSDRLADQQKKMQEYIANGARLGWLIDPRTRRIYVYRPGSAVERLDNPATVAGDPVLPGFLLDAQAVFDASY
jgi:Uma2 family endonuclease